jgi:general secretion pathway protein E
MLAMSPAFDVVGLALSIKKQCVVLRDGNQQLLVVLSDPFDINILPWLSAKIESPFSCALTLRGELLAYLSKQEESVRAVDQIIVEESKEITLPQNSAPILSFSSVSADSSPAVKLVNSTLYDALKAGASDVHIELLTWTDSSISNRWSSRPGHKRLRLGNFGTSYFTN